MEKSFLLLNFFLWLFKFGIQSWCSKALIFIFLFSIKLKLFNFLKPLLNLVMRLFYPHNLSPALLCFRPLLFNLKLFFNNNISKLFNLLCRINFFLMIKLKLSLEFLFLQLNFVQICFKFLYSILQLFNLFFSFYEKIFILIPFKFWWCKHTFNGKLFIDCSMSQLLLHLRILADFTIYLT